MLKAGMYGRLEIHDYALCMDSDSTEVKILHVPKQPYEPWGFLQTTKYMNGSSSREVWTTAPFTFTVSLDRK